MSITLSALQQQRRDTAANWTSANPTLLAGEWGYETDTGKWKVGDGSTAWTSLAYVAIPDNNGLIPIDQLLLPLGTAAAPSLTFTGDVDTGIYSPGANQLAISTNGTGRLFIDAGGRIGVGNLSPGSQAGEADNLVVGGGSGDTGISILSGTSSEGGLYFADGGGGSAYRGKVIYDHATDSLQLDTAGSERLRITSTGTLMHIGAGNSTTPAVQFNGSAPVNSLVIDSSGRLGLGTSSPAALLHVKSANTGSGQIYAECNTYNTNDVIGLDYRVAGGSLQAFSRAVITNGSTAATALTFGTASGGNNATEHVRIDYLGRVGVGTTSPVYQLDVKNPTTPGESWVRVDTASATDDCGYRFAHGGTNHFVINHDGTNDYLQFYDNIANSERLRITSDGKLGLGTSSPSSLIHLTGASGSGRIELENTSGSTVTNWRIAPVITGLTSNGFEIRDVTNSASRIVIDSSGNVGIGTTTVSAKLHIAGATGGGVAGIWDTTAGGARVEYKDNGTRRGFLNWDTSSLLLAADSGNSIKFSTNAGVTQHATIDSSGRLLVGTSTSAVTGPGEILQVVATDSGGSIVLGRNDSSISNGNAIGVVSFVGNAGGSYEQCARILAQADGTHATGDKPTRLVFSTTANSASSPTERMRIDSSGNVGIGTSSPSYLLDLGSSSGTVDDAAVGIRIRRSGVSNSWAKLDEVGGVLNIDQYNSTYPITRFRSSTDGSTFTERMRIDSSGNVGINKVPESDWSSAYRALELGYSSVSSYQGTAFPAINLSVNCRGTTSSYGAGWKYILAHKATQIHLPYSGEVIFRRAGTGTVDSDITWQESMRVDSDGDVLIGKTTAGLSTAGHEIFPDGALYHTASAKTAVYVNRLTNDGTLIDLRQNTTSEGTISVSGSTVSYNGAHLSRWSQLAGGAERTEILRGSVLSNLDEMCEWGEEDNEQLNRMKVSDVEGDRNVAGVFQAWDDDDDTYTNDFYCAMTGDFVIRIAQGTTVARGDLLMSAGDGTAKPQDDDIIRSKTIAKVTSTYVSCTYADGSYCVPCVLMAC